MSRSVVADEIEARMRFSPASAYSR